MYYCRGVQHSFKSTSCFFLFGCLAKDAKVTSESHSWLLSVFVEYLANESWGFCHSCKQYCKPQFQSREMPPCPYRQNSTDAEFCSCSMSHSIKATVQTSKKGLFPIKTLKQSYQRSKAAPPVLKRTSVRGRDLQQ